MLTRANDIVTKYTIWATIGGSHPLFFLGDANGTVLATRYYWKLVNRNGQAVNSLEKE